MSRLDISTSKKRINDYNSSMKHSDEKTDYIPTISILIPTYNREKHICDAINSALKQTTPAEEIIIVDDGSTDGTAELIKSFPPEKVKYILKEHSGAPKTRNRCISEASSDYILWLDSDDYLLENVVADYKVTIANNPEIDILYGTLLITDSELKPQHKLEHPDWYNNNRELLAKTFETNPVPNPGSLIRKELFARYGGYDSGYPRAHDYHWWSRVAPYAKFKKFGNPVLLWRWHDTNMSTGSVNFDTSYDIKVVEELFRRHSFSEIFPALDWEASPNNEAVAISYLQIAQRMLQLGNNEKGIFYLRKSIKALPIKEISEMLSQLEQIAEIPSNSKPEDAFENSLKIVLGVHHFPPNNAGGAELYTYHTARALKNLGHEVHIIAPMASNTKTKLSGPLHDIFDGIDIWILRHKDENLNDEYYNEKMGKSFGEVLNLINPDIVHFQHLLGLSASTLQETISRNIPSLMTLHDGWFACNQFHFLENAINYCKDGPETIDKCVSCFFNRNKDVDQDKWIPEVFYYMAARRRDLRKYFSQISRVLVPSKFLKEKLAEAGFVNEDIRHHQLGLNQKKKLDKVKRNGKIRFAVLGNIFATKGHDIILKAIDRLDPEKFSLSFYGRIANESFYQDLQNNIPAGYEVNFNGSYQPDQIPSILSEVDVCVIPSRSENYPTVLRESFDEKIPIIATNIGGIPEMIKDGKNGLLFESENSEDLALKMDLFIKNPERIDLFGQSVEPILSIENEVLTLVEHYRELIKLKH
jgi:glycosyltransferase involved in cell wall biosynthesis